MRHLMTHQDRRGDGTQPFCEATSADSHATIFGVSLAVVFTFCLTLSAVSSSTRVSQQSDCLLATTGAISVSASRCAVAALADGLQLGFGGATPVNGKQQ
jgi:hypothetical protein